jgi:hypothetical protein
MRGYWTAPVAAVALIAAVAGSARAGTYIPVPMVPGAVSEIVFSINNHNIVAGSFRDSANVEHGFFGPLDGSNWTTFDFPGEGTTGTEARSINDDGVIIGIATNPAFTVGEEFYRTADGTFSVFEKDGQPLDGVAQGLSAEGTSTGDYINTDGKTVGYVGRKGRYLEDFKLHLKGNKNFLQVSPRRTDDMKDFAVGTFVDQSAVQHGFGQTFDGRRYSVEQFDYPGAKGTALEDYGDLAYPGQWTDADGNTHAFYFNVRNHKGPFIDLDPEDGSSSQQAWETNTHGLVALSTNIGRSYIYCPKKNPEKCPSGGPMDRLNGRSVIVVRP